MPCKRPTSPPAASAARNSPPGPSPPPLASRAPRTSSSREHRLFRAFHGSANTTFALAGHGQCGGPRADQRCGHGRLAGRERRDLDGPQWLTFPGGGHLLERRHASRRCRERGPDFHLRGFRRDLDASRRLTHAELDRNRFFRRWHAFGRRRRQRFRILFDQFRGDLDGKRLQRSPTSSLAGRGLLRATAPIKSWWRRPAFPTYFDGLRRTLDGPRAPGIPVNASMNSVASSADGTHLVAVGNGVAYVSGNSGASWSTISVGSGTLGSVACSADGSHLVTVSVTGPIFTIHRLRPPVGRPRPALPPDGPPWPRPPMARTQLAAVPQSSGQVYLSMDSGVSWTSQRSTPAATYTSVASSSEGLHLIASPSSSVIYTAAPAALATGAPGSTGTLQYLGNGQWSPVAEKPDRRRCRGRHAARGQCRACG